MEHIIMNIKREQRGFSVTELSVLSKVDKSLISRYLSGKISLSKDKVNAIYQSIGEYLACTQTSKNDLMNYVKEFYSGLIDLKEPKIKFQEYIESDWKHARDESYIVWLIGMLLYMHFLKEKPILVQKKELINTLIKYEMYIPFEFYSMFYCTIAIYFAEYDNKGNILTEIDVDANVQNTYTYDSYNNLTSVTTTDLDDVTNVSVVTYTYDADGRVLSEINEDYTNTYEYNQLGAVLLQKVNDEYTRNVYNDKGQLKVTINHEDYLESEDGLQQTPKSDVYTNTNKGTRYSYTAVGRIKTIVSPDDMVTVNVYDENGNLQKESNYNKNNYNAETDNYMYQTVYLTNGLVERYRVNGTTKLLNTYDGKYNLIKVAYGNSQNIQYSYSSESNPSNETNNIDNLLMGVTFKNDSAPRFTYSYDKYGELVETIDVKNNTKTVFNDNGYVISDLSDENNVIQSYTSNDDIITEEVLNQTYTSVFDNDTISLKKNDVNVITSMKEYDSNGEMDSLQTTLSNNNQSVTLTETPTYDKELITNYAIGGINNATCNFQYTYDEDKNIKKEYGSFINNFYTYDDNNQLIRVIDSINNRTTVFKYDARGNLIKETVYGKNDYADNGNDAAPLNEIIYTYGNGDWQDKLTKVNYDTITYDGAGNRTSYDGWNYTWEGGRQLVSMSKGDTTITYKYDDSGIRTEKKVNDKIIRYTTVDGRITSQDDGTNKLYFYYDECDSLLGFEHNGTPYLYIRNIQGDIYGITDVNGTLLVQYEYDAWGKVKDITGNQTLGQLNPMRYRGYYYDEETGLYYLQSRYYDASVRRFINADVFEMIGNSDSYISYNLYAYCENNVVNLIDTYGYTGFMYSYKYYKDIRYDYTLKRYIGGKPYIFQFVLHKNFSDDAKEGKKE